MTPSVSCLSSKVEKAGQDRESLDPGRELGTGAGSWDGAGAGTGGGVGAEGTGDGELGTGWELGPGAGAGTGAGSRGRGRACGRSPHSKKAVGGPDLEHRAACTACRMHTSDLPLGLMTGSARAAGPRLRAAGTPAYGAGSGPRGEAGGPAHLS